MSKAAKRERQRQNREAAREYREKLVKRHRRIRGLRGFLIVLVPVIAVVAFLAWRSAEKDSGDAVAVTCEPEDATPPSTNPPQTFTQVEPVASPTATYTATIDTTCGAIEVELDSATAPNAVNNFVFLAQKGFYDGLLWHRAAEDFVIQGGDPNGDGSGGPGYSVQGEVPTDSYPEGSLAAAKSGDEAAGTFGSQFFIVTGANGASLPNDYARFGSVTSGIEVAQKIESFAPPEGDGPPTRPLYIKTITINQTGGTGVPTESSAP